VSEDDIERFFRSVGLGGPDTDFRALPTWNLSLSGRQTFSWYDERAIRSMEAGIDGYERLDTPTLLIRGRGGAPWLRSVVDVLAEGMPNTAVAELDGGHAGILEHQDDFVSALNGHLSG
jgi:pimeloyl-ACP methyl ester carboxylesterase